MLVSGGLVAALLREATFSTIRMGGYEEIKNIVSRDSTEPIPLYKVGSPLLIGEVTLFLTRVTLGLRPHVHVSWWKVKETSSSLNNDLCPTNDDKDGAA